MKTGGLHPVKADGTKKLDKEQKLKEQKELAMLFKPVQTQKIEKGMNETKAILLKLLKNEKNES